MSDALLPFDASAVDACLKLICIEAESAINRPMACALAVVLLSCQNNIALA